MSIALVQLGIPQTSPSPTLAPSQENKQFLPRRVTVGFDGEETMQLAEFPLNISQEPGIMLPVTFKGKTYTFMLDTGATATVVDERLRGLLGKKVSRNQAESAVGTIQDIDLYAPMDAMVGPLSLKDCGLVSVSDFSTLKKIGVDVPYDGVLGMSFIGKYLWVFAWDDEKVCVCESMAPLKVRQAKAKIQKGAAVFTYIPILLSGEKVSALLDTGYGSVIALNESQFEGQVKRGMIGKVNRMSMAMSDGIHQVEFGLLNEFSMPRGDALHVFRKVLVSRSNRARLGLPFLKAYFVVWDVPAGMMTLVPQKMMRKLYKKEDLSDAVTPLFVPDPQIIPMPKTYTAPLR